MSGAINFSFFLDLSNSGKSGKEKTICRSGKLPRNMFRFFRSELLSSIIPTLIITGGKEFLVKEKSCRYSQSHVKNFNKKIEQSCLTKNRYD
jgi:hypothetical protein